MPLLLLAVTAIGYLFAYRLYGRFLGQKIFNLVAGKHVPSIMLKDGVDFVPTKKEIIFGHHFTSIAGTGPIVGPAIAIIWGWLPAVIWIFFGSIFMGAVHDFGTLVISMRNEGKSLVQFTQRYINHRIKVLLFAIMFFELLIVIAIFGLVIASIFHMFPASVFPVWFEIPIAMVLGWYVYKKGKSPLIPSIIALVLMYLTIAVGYYAPFDMPELWGIPPTGIWTIILLIYAFIASILPITTLLQPRDYINSHQLVVAMILLVVGVIVAQCTTDMTIVAPAINASPAKAPSMVPFLFITVACGAISGFHCLVSSGTSSKQVECETDALFVGYGSMLTEGFLAILVVIAVSAGIGLGYDELTGIDAWNAHYASWEAAQGLGSKINAFVQGSANMVATLGIPHFIAVVVMGVFIASFASTTLDSAVRIQRYVITELAHEAHCNVFANRYIATGIAVVTGAWLAFSSGMDGKGALSLWPLFGCINQTLATLALIVITLYLKGLGGRKWMVSGLPALLMIVITIYATVVNELTYIEQGNTLLSIIGGIVVLIIVWTAVEGLLKFKHLHTNPSPEKDI